MSSMSVAEAIRARRSIRKYTGQPLADETVRELLEAARLAPSSVNSQPWRFKVVRDRQEIEWIATTGSKGQRWAATAGAIFLCCVDTSGFVAESRATYKYLKDSGALVPEMEPGLDDLMERMAQLPRDALRWAGAINTSIAMTMMLLRATELGLGSCWMGMYDENAVKQRFDVPEELDLVAMLAVGAPDEAPAPRPRKTLEEILIP